MSCPRFSVVIPVFNGERFVARAIESVLAQSYRAEEIVVVDDGSTDNTPAIVANYRSHVKYVRETNQGVSAARNLGARTACGEWLAFLDADDWYLPDRLLWHAEWLSRDPSLDFLTGDYEYRREDGSLIGRSMETKSAGRNLLSRATAHTEVVMEAADFENFVAESLRRHAHAFGAAIDLSGTRRLPTRLQSVRRRTFPRPLSLPQPPRWRRVSSIRGLFDPRRKRYTPG